VIFLNLFDGILDFFRGNDVFLLDFSFEWFSLLISPLNIREVISIPERKGILDRSRYINIFFEDVFLKSVINNLQIMTNGRK